MLTSEMTPTLFLDFDGTITKRDATDAILEAYADPQWLQVEEAWKSARIGSRDCLRAQMALVTATRQELDALLDAIEIDEGFVTLVDACAAHAVPVHIVSDGFDYCIQRILNRPSLDLGPHLKGIRVASSHLELNGTGWRVGFTSEEPCEHGCATCKPAAMARLNTTGGPAVFVGDGLSDRYAAAYADTVFAKDLLAAYCDERAISYTLYDSLATVARWLED
jgi:2-hydroxy-3-keto-5-methylthiopentenyl-1-phosphate phosphatase